MKSFTLFAAICALALSAEAAKTVNAATVTDTIDFTASGFPAGAPVDPVTGSFTVTLDPAVGLVVGSAIKLNNINITPSANSLVLNYDPTNLGGTFMLCSGGCSLGGGINSFVLEIENFQFAPSFTDFTYTRLGDPSLFATDTGSVTVVAIPGALPGMLSVLMGGGFLAWWRKRRLKIA
jgi:hypothetical protein